jgi:hypothetical protein
MKLDRDGFALIPGLLSAGDCRALVGALAEEPADTPAASQRAGAIYARRNLASHPAVRALLTRPEVSALFSMPLHLVRAILFDKVPGANWPVPWHQDLSVVVKERVDLPGWGPWSVKAGLVHVQPPAPFLERMLALRLHLDPCPVDNGALKVLPGTHTQGRLTAEVIQTLRESVPETLCPAATGDALLMRPLLLHASAPALQPTHRRVLHLELAPPDLLPPPLVWFGSLPSQSTAGEVAVK